MKNNLSPEAAPWGRDIERRLSSIEGTVATLSQDSTNAFSSLSGTLAQLSGQVKSIQTVLNKLSRFTTTYLEGVSTAIYVPAATPTGDWTDLITVPITFSVDTAFYASFGSPEALVGMDGGAAGAIQAGFTSLRIVTQAPSGEQTVHTVVPRLNQNLSYNGTPVSAPLSGITRLYPAGGVNGNTLKLQMGGGHTTNQSGSVHIVQIPYLTLNSVPLT